MIQKDLLILFIIAHTGAFFKPEDALFRTKDFGILSKFIEFLKDTQIPLSFFNLEFSLKADGVLLILSVCLFNTFSYYEL